MALSPILIAGILFFVNSIIYLIYVDDGDYFSIYMSIFFFLYLVVYWFLTPRTVYDKSSYRVRISDKLYGKNTVLVLGLFSGSYAVLSLIMHSGQTDLLAIASHYSRLRYVEDVGMPVGVRVSNVFLYFSLIVSSLIFVEKKRFSERGFLYLLPAGFLLLETFLLGTKSILIMVAMYFLISYFIVNMYHGPKLRGGNVVIKMMLYAFIVFALVLAAHYVRSSGQMAISDIVVKIVTSYFLIPSFAFFSEAGKIDQLLSVGASSISGISVYMFDDIVKRGEPIYFNVFGGIYETNVYTAMFYLVKDFGHVGFLFLLVSLLFLSLYLERRIRNGSIFVAVLYIPLSAFYLFAFADPILKELTNILSFLMLSLYLFVSACAYNLRATSRFTNIIDDR